jgi:hypothetical protein
MDERKKELLKLVNNDLSLEPTIDEFLFIENQLVELKKLPFIKIHPKDPTRQKSTPAAKLYKELLQQYTNILKVLMRITGTDEADEESPLRKWVKSRKEML